MSRERKTSLYLHWLFFSRPPPARRAFVMKCHSAVSGSAETPHPRDGRVFFPLYILPLNPKVRGGGEASGLGEESLMPSMTLVPPGRPRWGGGKATATYPPLPTPSNDQTFSSSPVAPSLLPDISVRIFPPPLSFFPSLSPYRLRARSPLGSAASSSFSSPWWLLWGSLASSASPPPSSSSRLYPF